MNNYLKRPCLLFLLLTLSACASLPSPQQRYDIAKQLANSAQWQIKSIPTSSFDLVSYQAKHYDKEKLLTIYIEGDGFAWRTKKMISTDPTPINPLGLKLALSHAQGNAVYLARPCQYSGGLSARNCTQHDWTDARFSERVVASTNEAINSLKIEYSAQELQLIGYSGGGAIGALVAARRHDVVKLATVAGNLNPELWTNYHHISSLSESLNPANYREQLASIQQVHFVGADDRVIPKLLAEDFVSTYADRDRVKLIVVPGFDHHCCWAADWPDLLDSVHIN